MKRLILIGLLTLALPRPGFASNDSIAALVAKGDALDQQFKTQESLSAYLEAEKLGATMPTCYGRSRASTRWPCRTRKPRRRSSRWGRSP